MFFCSAVHTIKSRVIEGTGSTVAAQSWTYCSEHSISKNLQIFRRVPAGFLTTAMLGISMTLPGKASLALLLPSAQPKYLGILSLTILGTSTCWWQSPRHTSLKFPCFCSVLEAHCLVWRGCFGVHLILRSSVKFDWWYRLTRPS